MAKSRLSMTQRVSGVSRSYSGQQVISTSVFEGDSLRRERLLSQGNPWPPRSRFMKKRRIGGNFDSLKAYCLPGAVTVSAKTKSVPTGFWSSYDGHIVAYNMSYNANLTITPSSDAELNRVGTNLIASAIPTNPLVDLGQFIGELRELPRKPDIGNWRAIAHNFLKTYRKSPAAWRAALRSGSGDYLNITFGWEPFVRSILDTVELIPDFQKKLDTFNRNSGRVVRRDRRLPANIETTTAAPVSSPGAPALSSSFYVSHGKRTVVTVTSTEQWFSGAFTYYLPDESTRLNRMRRFASQARHMLGLRLDPELLWDLAPWSWAADWVGNVGNIVHNWSAFSSDGLVMKYGYVMERKEIRTTHILQDLVLKEHGSVTAVQTYVQVSKARRTATPYGFGLNPGSFSARQTSILIALGLNRGL